MLTIDFAAKKRKKNTRTCSKGYNCGNSCINKQLKCKRKFGDQASTYAGWLKKQGQKAKPGKATKKEAKVAKLAAKQTLDSQSLYSGKIDFSNMKKAGEGNFGAVYFDSQGRAIKEENHNSSEFFVKQQNEGARLQNIMAEQGYSPKVLQQYTHGDKLYTVMEALEGYKSIEDGIEDSSLKKEYKGIKKNLDVAVGKLYDNNIRHGDLHEGNVMYNPKTGDVKIIDYGFAKVGLEDPKQSKKDFLDKNFLLNLVDVSFG